MMIFNYL